MCPAIKKLSNETGGKKTELDKTEFSEEQQKRLQ
jgi:hypothetical protein